MTTQKTTTPLTWNLLSLPLPFSPGRGRALPIFLFSLLLSPIASAQHEEGRYIVGFQGTVQAEHRAEEVGLEVALELPEINAVAARLTADQVEDLEQRGDVAYVEPDPPRYPMAQTTPYGVPMVQASEIQAGDGPITVCVIDSGYDLGHKDLPRNGVSGWGGTWGVDECGHGTHVAGTIAALDNKKGVVGVTPGVSLYIARVFSGDCESISTSTVIDAAFACRDAGARVLNLSLGCTGAGCKSTAEKQAYDQLWSQGYLIFAAAGNDGNRKKSYPASYDSVISVAAVDEQMAHAEFSQQNNQVELAAPGVGVQSTEPTGTGFETLLKVKKEKPQAIPMEGSPDGKARGPLVDCGLGDAPCPGGGGQICLIQRGELFFSEKVLACQDGGGVGAVIYNNVPGSVNGTLGETATIIPSVSITQADGETLLTLLGKKARLKVDGDGDYGYRQGTSMATPHASGVAALVWSHNPNWTNSQVREALTATAQDLGDPGRDYPFGFGLIQARAAMEYLQNQ